MSTRRKLDAYFTPEWATGELCKRVAIAGVILECCNGEGAITRVLAEEEEHRKIVTNDVDLSLPANLHMDAAAPDFWQVMAGGGYADWVVTNPPFNVAPEIIPQAWEHANEGIAMLLRASYTEPCHNRQEWLAEHADYLSDIIYLPRISFTGDGSTDNMSCNWYVWRKHKIAGCRLHWVLKSSGAARAALEPSKRDASATALFY